MEPTTTNRINLGSVIDFVGPALAPPADKSPSPFGFLLQTPAPSRDRPIPPPPATIQNERAQPATQQGPPSEDETPAAYQSESDPADDETHSEQPSSSSEAQAESAPSSAADESAPGPAAESADEAIGEDEAPSEEQEIVVESLAGLATVALPKVASPTVAPADELAEASPVETVLKQPANVSIAPDVRAQTVLAHHRGEAIQESSVKPKTGVPPSADSSHKKVGTKAPEEQLSHNEAQLLVTPATQSEEPVNKPVDVDQAKFAASETVESNGETQEKEPREEKSPSLELKTPDTKTTEPRPHSGTKSDQPIASAAVAPSSSTETGNISPQSSQAAAGIPATAPNSPSQRMPAGILTSATGGANHLARPQMDTTRLLHRVVRAFGSAQDRDGEVRIRLSPPELGALRLEVRVHDGVLAAHMQAETSEARTAILDNLPVLRERLAEQGIRIERFDVDLMQRQSGGMPDQAGSRQQEPTPQVRVMPATRNRAEAAATGAGPRASASSANGLNVIV